MRLELIAVRHTGIQRLLSEDILTDELRLMKWNIRIVQGMTSQNVSTTASIV